MHTSKMSSRGQVTIPKKIRDSLELMSGDLVSFQLEDGTARLRRMSSFDFAFHEALVSTLGEWISPEDEDAFRYL